LQPVDYNYYISNLLFLRYRVIVTNWSKLAEILLENHHSSRTALNVAEDGVLENFRLSVTYLHF